MTRGRGCGVVPNPGTHIPGILAAGSGRAAGSLDFVLIRKRRPSVVIDLEGDEQYRRLILTTRHGLALTQALRLDVSAEPADVEEIVATSPTAVPKGSRRPVIRPDLPDGVDGCGRPDRTEETPSATMWSGGRSRFSSATRVSRGGSRRRGGASGADRRRGSRHLVLITVMMLVRCRTGRPRRRRRPTRHLRMRPPRQESPPGRTRRRSPHRTRPAAPCR